MKRMLAVVVLCCAIVSCTKDFSPTEYANVRFSPNYTTKSEASDVIANSRPDFAKFPLVVKCDKDANDVYDIETGFDKSTFIPLGTFKVSGEYRAFKIGDFDGGVSTYSVPALRVDESVEFHSYTTDIILDVKHDSFCIMFKKGEGVTDVQLKSKGEWKTCIGDTYEDWSYTYVCGDTFEMRIVCDGTTDFQTEVLSIGTKPKVENGRYYVAKGGAVLSAYFTFGSAVYEDFTDGGTL